MNPERVPDAVLRIDVTGTLAAVALVERLRWARPSVHPLAGSDWRLVVPSEADRERVLDAVRSWLREQELPAISISVDGATRHVVASA